MKTIVIGSLIGIIAGSLLSLIVFLTPSQTFCDLNEQERLDVCPEIRIKSVTQDKGEITFYKCSKTLGYVETSNLSDRDYKDLTDAFSTSLSKGFQVNIMCEKNNKKVYQIRK